MITMKFFPMKYLILLASAFLFLPSCNLLKGEDPIEPKPLMGSWQLDRTIYKLTFNDQDLIRYLRDDQALTQAEAERMRTDIIADSALPFIRRIVFNSDYETIRMIKGDSDDFVYGTFKIEDNNSLMRITQDASGEEWVFTIIQIGGGNFIIGSSEIQFHDINGDGKNENIDLEYQLEFVRG